MASAYACAMPCSDESTSNVYALGWFSNEMVMFGLTTWWFTITMLFFGTKAAQNIQLYMEIKILHYLNSAELNLGQSYIYSRNL